MIFSSWSSEELLSFFMVLIRVSTLMAIVPVFGDRGVPSTVKVMLSLAFSVILFPLLKSSGLIRLEDAAVWSETTGRILAVVATEVMVGLAVGFASQLVFHAIQTGGDFMAQFMGLSMASVYDPHMEGQTMVLGQMLSALAMLTFLAMDGHHILLRAVIETFRFIPQGHFVLSEQYRLSMISMTGNTMLFGMQLAAPMACCMMLVNIIYGIMGKALPQLNILTLSLASSVLIGSFVLVMSYPSVQSGMTGIFHTYFDDLQHFMVVYGGK